MDQDVATPVPVNVFYIGRIENRVTCTTSRNRDRIRKVLPELTRSAGNLRSVTLFGCYFYAIRNHLVISRKRMHAFNGNASLRAHVKKILICRHTCCGNRSVGIDFFTPDFFFTPHIFFTISIFFPAAAENIDR